MSKTPVPAWKFHFPPEFNKFILAEEKEYKTDWLFARSEPFPVCTVNDFLASPPHSIQELEDQMVKHLTLNPKKNDLYQFSQSDEIMKMRNGIFTPI